MPDAATLDLDSIARAAGVIADSPPPQPSQTLDLDAIARSAPADPTSDKRLQLILEKSRLQSEASGVDLALSAPSMVFDPAGTFFRGLRATGNILAGAGEDVALGIASPWTGQQPSFENLRSALMTYEPTPAEKALAEEKGIGAGLTSGVVGAVKTVPTLAAGALITALTKVPPEVVYPALFGGETYEHTGDVLQSAKAAIVGLAYPVLGRAVKPLAAALINRLGVVSSPVTQKAIETTVDQGLMQAFTHVISLPEYAQMTPEQRERAIAENTGNILVFALPRVVGYAAGHPSEYEAAIRQEANRLTEYFQIPDIPERPMRTPEQRAAADEERRQAEQRATEATFQFALRTPSRRLAAQFAQEQGIPVEVRQPAPATTEVTPEIGAEVPNSFIGRTVTFTQQLTTTSTPHNVSAKVVKATRRENTRGGSQMVEVHYDDGTSTAVNAGLQSDGRFIPWDEGVDYAIRIKGKLEPIEKGAPSAPIPIVRPGIVSETPPSVSVPPVETQIRPGEERTPAGKTEVQRPADAGAGAVTVEAGTVPYQFKIGQEVWDAYYQKKGTVIDRRSSMIQIGDGDEVPLQWVPGGPGQVKLRYADGKEEWQGAQWIRESGQPTRAEIEVEGQAVPPKQLAAPPERIALRNNIATELPEFTLEAINRRLPEPRTGRTFPASVLFDPKQKGFLLIKGPSPRATYRIPLSEIPHEIVKGKGITIDKQAVLAFLNDKAKRQAALVDDRNVTHYAPEDIDVIIKPPVGRPSTGAGTPLQPVPLHQLPKVQKKVGQPVSNRRQLMDVTRRAFDDLRARNPQAIEQLLGRRPEELDDPFWDGIRDELVKSDWVAATENPLATAEALVADLRRLKEGGDLEWLASIAGTKLTPDLKRELLPFFELLKLSDEQLKELGKRGSLGPEPPKGQTHAEADARDVISGQRLFGYFEPYEWGYSKALSLAKKGGLIIEKGTDKFGKGLIYFYKPENAPEAKRRMALLNMVRYTPGLQSAWEYLHGAILGYRPEDIAFYLTHHPLEGFGERVLSNARYVLAELERPTRGMQGALSETGEPTIARAAQEAANLREARKLVDDPNNGLSEEARAILRDILDSPVAAYLNGRQIRFRLVDAIEGGLAGRYNPFTELIEIARGRDPSVGAHEFFHPLWEMIQDSDRLAIERWRRLAIEQMLKGTTGKNNLDLRSLRDGTVRHQEFLEMGINPAFYPLSTAEEFFAWMMTDRFQKDRLGIWGQAREIFESQNAFLAKIRLIIEAIFDAIRQRIPALQGPVERLQRQILGGKYEVIPEEPMPPITAEELANVPPITPELMARLKKEVGEQFKQRGDRQRGTQGSIDEQFDELKDKGSHILRAGPGDVEIELDINKKQLMALVGPQMYSKPIVEVATKELLQNAFDTARSAGATYENPGTIEIKTDYDNRTLMVKDTGTGMTPEIIRTAFFTIGGTYKTGSLENTSGGLGLAKMAFILGSEHIRVESNRNGLKSIVDASSDQIRSSKFKIQTERTDEPNGTTVTVKIPENYTDAYGEQKSIYFNSYPSFLTQPLIGPVKVIFNGAELPIGINLKGWQKENEFNFGWGRIDLYIDPREKRDYPTTHVLSAGLKQFEDDPWSWNDKKLPYNLILDVRPKVKTDNAAYPFNNQREGWRATIKEDVDAMYAFLKRMAVEQELLQAKEAFTSIRQLEKVDPMKDWTPEEMADMERRYFRKKSEPPPPIRKQKEVESVDFRGPDVVIHYRDGTAITESKSEYVKKTFEAKREIDLKKTEIDVSDMDPSVPNLHNNVTVEFDDIPRAGTLITETGNVLLNFMREWGKKVGGEYEQLTDASITGWFGGISFDKNYRGLNMVKPMRAIWFNLGLFSSAGRSSPAASASEALHIFIHEITHVVARTEGADFTAELANNYARLRSADIPVEIFEGTLDKIFTTNWEAFNEINDRLQNYNTRNRAESFQSSSAVGPERPGEAARPGEGPLGINAPGVVGIPEQGRAGLGGTRPADRSAGPIGDIIAGQAAAESGLPAGISRSRTRGTQGALESREAVEEHLRPLEETETPERFRAMASVLNKGLVSPAAADRFFSLPIGVNLELKDVFTGRIGTHAEGGPTFREVMNDPNRTPEEKSNYSRYALMEWLGYQSDRQKVIDRRDKTLRDLDEATLKAIAAIPKTNEAELRAVISLGTILDRIKAERERTAEGAQINERIREGIDHLDALNDLLRQPLAMSRALRGIADVVGRAALTAARPGEEVLELVSERSGFAGGVFATPRQWVRALSAHLARMEDPMGERMINASQDVIEATLWGLRQVGDYRQELLEARLTEDGTLRRFNADYMNDLRSKTPRGFEAILKDYATAKVEADALRSAARRLNNRILTLEERRRNLDQAVTFLTDHDANPEFIDFGKAMTEFTESISGIERTDTGFIAKVRHPLTGADVTLDLGFGKGESVETIRLMQQLAEAGLEYGTQLLASPIKSAWWKTFEENLHNYLQTGNPNYDMLKDPLIDPVKELTKLKYALIVESNLSRIPGILPMQTTRAAQALGTAIKTENEIAKAHKQRMLNDNQIALRSHTVGLKDSVKTLRQWRDEVSGPIIDSMQHYGQIVYRVGNRIAGFGHVITPEDMKAVRGQYEYDQRLINLTGGSEKIPAVKEFQTRIKDPEHGILRKALSQGPGTTTRFLPDESRRLPAEWNAAVEKNQVDAFLNSGDNFIRVVLGHVMEDERNYVLLGKGRFAADYKAMRTEKQSLQASGRIPNSLNSLSQFIADLHNEYLGETEEPATAGDVRRTLIEEVSNYMKQVSDDTAKKETAAKVDIVSHENEYTQARGRKIAPGSLYRYGITDNIDVMTKGNNALEPYVVRVRDYLKLTEDALLKEKGELLKTLNKMYESEGIVARRKAGEIITAGIAPEGPSLLQKHQMAMEEIKANIDRVGKLLQNFKDILNRREEFYGDDIISQLIKPVADASVGTVLLNPASWILNRASGEVNWGLKLAEVRRGGWLTMPTPLLKAHVKSFMRAVQRQYVPKNQRDRILKSLMSDATDAVGEHFTGILADIQDWEQMRRSGVIDSYSYKDAVGWDNDRPLGQNIRGVVDALRDLRSEPSLSARREFFGTLGMFPRAWSTLIRKVGMRQVDNSLNVQAIAIGNSLADLLQKRAIRSFDGRLEQDPVFQRIYREYGDNFKQFALKMAGAYRGGTLLTPAELTGRFNPLNMGKAAVQMRRTFQRNNDPVDLIMLKYWWNKRHANGDRNAPFMTPGQRWALEWVLAEDANMSSISSRPTWFMGSRERQMMGVLNQWWLWNTDRLRDLYSKVRGQKTYGARYLPAVIGFLFATAFASLLGTTVGQKINEMAFNTLSKNPGYLDAETDEERLRILIALSANYWGAIGSLIKFGTDTPGKLGFRNPAFYYNVAQDIMGMVAKMYQSGDIAGPGLDFVARYNPPLRAIINRLPGREGLIEVRNAANALRAATPGSMEARTRQPTSGTDIRATPMTPLYNAILNAAAVGDWGTADEAFAKAVDQARANGNPNPEQAIISAIRTRSPETSVYTRALTDGEREQVYGRLSPENRATVDRVNNVFQEIASRYGTGGGALAGGRTAGIAGGRGFGGLPAAGRIGAAASLPVGFGGRLSLGAPRGVRYGFRSRSLRRRGLRTRNLLRGGLRRTRRSRLRRLAV
jgi:hypothetical protein